MDYNRQNLKYHFKTRKGWVNDPNGLVYFDGYYHVFYQHCPTFEYPWEKPMHWGHARTRDFLNWEELPVALFPGDAYDKDGCWSGTATVYNDTLYLFYTSVLRDEERHEWIQTVSVAFSKDGVNFEKYENNPVIETYPADGGPDFRDPAIAHIGGKYYLAMATGNPESKKGRVLLYESETLLNWEYKGIMIEWDDCKFTECPSFMNIGEHDLLSVSVCPLESDAYFNVMAGKFDGAEFATEIISKIDVGPDQYAGQIFKDDKGRTIMITWLPGWKYEKKFPKDVGCMSIPREIFIKDGKICSYPVKEVAHLIKTKDDAIEFTDDGFVIKRENRENVVHKGEIRDIAIIRDEYILEVFINGGEKVYSVLL